MDIKGVVHFKKKTFADNLLALMSSKMSMSFNLQFSRKEIKDNSMIFLHIMHFTGNQTVQGPKKHFQCKLQTFQRALNDFRR